MDSLESQIKEDLDHEFWVSTTSTVGIYSGHLIKLGAIRKNWKKRFFCVGWKYLSYYDERMKYLNKIDLTTCTEVNSGDNDYHLSLVTESRNWYFKCDDISSKSTWIYILSLLIYQHKRRRRGCAISIIIERIVGYSLYILNAAHQKDINIKSFANMLIPLIFSISNEGKANSMNKINANIKSFVESLISMKSMKIIPNFTSISENICHDLKTIVNLIMSSSTINLFSPSNNEIKLSPRLMEPSSAPASLVPEIDDEKHKSNSSVIALKSKSEKDMNHNKIKNAKKKNIRLISSHLSIDKLESSNISSIYGFESLPNQGIDDKEETCHESVLRLTKKIQKLLLKQVESFQSFDKDSLFNYQNESVEASTQLWDIIKNFISTIESTEMSKRIILAKSQFISAWKDTMNLFKDNINIKDPSAAILLLKEKLPPIAKSLSDGSKALIDAVLEASYILIIEKELKESVDMYNVSSNTSNPIALKIIVLVKVLAKECQSFLGTNFMSNRLNEFKNGLIRVRKTLINIINDCHTGDINLHGMPKNVFLDVLMKIRDFSDQLTSVIDLTIRDGKQNGAILQISATLKQLYNVLEPLLNFNKNSVDDLEGNQSSDTLKKQNLTKSLPNLFDVNDPKVTDTDNKTSSRSDLLKKSSSTWKKFSTPSKASSLKLDLNRVNTKSKDSDKSKSINLWEEEEEGNTIYLSVTEAEDIEVEEKRAILLSSSSQPTFSTQIIKAATLNKLIVKLTHESSVDVHFLKSFLATYRSFTTPEVFWVKILERYNAPPPPLSYTEKEIEDYQKNVIIPIRLRVVNVLVKWISTCWMDISDSLMEEIEKFANESILKDNKGLHSKIKTAMDKAACDKKMANSQENSRFLRPRSGRDRMKLMQSLAQSSSINDEQMPLLDYLSDPQTIAEHLTSIDWKVFSNIKHVELLNQAWNKKELKHLAPNVLKMITRFNQLSAWVASNILWQEQLSRRVRMFSGFIQVAKCLYIMNNFNSTMSILSGLNSSAVYRLKFTLNELPKKDKQTFKHLMNKMSNKFSYKDYRNILKNANPPIIPYLGVYLTDLTFIEEGNKDMINNLINFHKRRLVYRVLSEIEQYQLVGYNFKTNPALTSLLTQLSFGNEEELYSLSLLREPRNAERYDII